MKKQKSHQNVSSIPFVIIMVRKVQIGMSTDLDISTNESFCYKINRKEKEPLYPVHHNCKGRKLKGFITGSN